MLKIWNNPMLTLSKRLEVAIDEIKRVRSMHDAQCECTDEWADKYRAEVERKADATLLARIAELEESLATVNARLAATEDGE